MLFRCSIQVLNVRIHVHLHETSHWLPKDRRIFGQDLLSIHFNGTTSAPVVANPVEEIVGELSCLENESPTYNFSPVVVLSSLIFFK